VPTDSSSPDVDVVVVGAGLAGLTAARDLVRRGLTVRILEATDRAGGRVFGAPLNGEEMIEMGGQWVGPTQDHVLDLVSEFGLRTHSTHVIGDHLYLRHGELSRYPADGGPIPPVSATALSEVLTLIGKLQGLSAQVDPAAPWTAAAAAEWDSTTFADWVEANTTMDDARMLVDYVTRGTNAIEPRQISLLHMLRYVASAGNASTPGSLLRVVVTADGASQWRIAGGSQRIAEGLTAEVAEYLELSMPVRLIRQTAAGVEVVTPTASITARRAIIAIPPTAAQHITFEPGLPAARIRLQEGLQTGGQIKVNVVYPRPFWRDAGLSGYVCSDTPPVQNVWDNTPASGALGVLVAFIKGDAALRFDDADDKAVEHAVLEHLQRYFGEQAGHPEHVHLRRWHAQPYVWGCPGALPTPGLLTEAGAAMREPVGQLHWAGTETAIYWQGFMDGAVGSGHRAADEVLAALGEHSASPVLR
jgi:monoamine oxidase